MKKSIITISSVICIIFMLCSCEINTNDNSFEENKQNVAADEAIEENADTTANIVETTIAYVEPSGVPDSVILREVSVPENTTYEITHNYDAASYIDDALLTMRYNGAFGTEITTYSYAYQYDRSSDLWELLSESKDEKNSLLTYDKEAYQNKSPFTGSTNEYHNCTYCISVLDLDVENMKATIQYSVDFSSNSVPDLNNTATVELWYANTGEGPCFTIPYTRSIVVRDQMYFMLSIDEGVRFVR